MNRVFTQIIRRICLLSAILAGLTTEPSQAAPEVSPQVNTSASASPGSPPVSASPAAASEQHIRITFLPPPVENGAISLGLFDSTGKLVRVLHRAATQKDFVVGLNGFITKWDGRDDAGMPLPPGKYAARGYMVGDLEVEGVAFHGNDWIEEDAAPHFKRITALKNEGRDEIRVTFLKTDGSEQISSWNMAAENAEAPKISITAEISEGKLVIKHQDETAEAKLADGEKVIAVSVGYGDQAWAIVENAEGREVRAYSAKGEFMRRLAYEKEEPQPHMIAASHWNELIFLAEENSTEQRLRSLALGSVEKSAPQTEGTDTSNWRVVYQKSIFPSDTFEQAAPLLKREPPFEPVPSVQIETPPNPLFDDKQATVKLEIGHDDKGAYLKASDGIPLIHITTTPHLLWAKMAQEKNGIVVLESDGSVVEEFLIKQPGNLMTFDAGEYEIKPPGDKKPASETPEEQ